VSITILSTQRSALTVVKSTATVHTTEPATRTEIIAAGLAALGETTDSVFDFGIEGEKLGDFVLRNAAGEEVRSTSSWYLLQAGLITIPGSTWSRERTTQHFPIGTYVVYAHRD
jgi:hypothetical protein